MNPFRSDSSQSWLLDLKGPINVFLDPDICIMANGRRNSIYTSVASQEGATGGGAELLQGPLIGFENAVF